MLCTLETWQTIQKKIPDIIVQASSTDCDDGWRPWTIGMSWQYVYNYFKGDRIQIGESHIFFIVEGLINMIYYIVYIYPLCSI